MRARVRGWGTGEVGERLASGRTRWIYTMHQVMKIRNSESEKYLGKYGKENKRAKGRAVLRAGECASAAVREPQDAGTGEVSH